MDVEMGLQAHVEEARFVFMNEPMEHQGEEWKFVGGAMSQRRFEQEVFGAGASGCAQQGAVGSVPGGGAAVHGPGAGHAGGGARAAAAGAHVRHGRLCAAPRAGARRRSRRQLL